MKFGSFRIKSGRLSPYYIDLSWLLSSPKDFCCIVDIVTRKIGEMITSYRVEKLASIELKGALILPSLACRLNIPGVVVRKKPKHYGLEGKIAGGTIVGGEKILFFDDVISDGMSKLEGIKPLEELGAQVEHVMVLVDREQGGRENIEKAGYKFYALTKTSQLIMHLFQSQQISEKQAKEILNFLKS
ncbi:MAG: orotate phosphoribosyltransferase [Candidatus Bathyarchaeota archaeon]